MRDQGSLKLIAAVEISLRANVALRIRLAPLCFAALARTLSMRGVHSAQRPPAPGQDGQGFFRLRLSRHVIDAAEITANIVAKRLVEHLERSGFVVMKKPPTGGSAPGTR